MSKRKTIAKPRVGAFKEPVTSKKHSVGPSKDSTGEFSLPDMQQLSNLVSTAFLNQGQLDQESLSQRIQAVKSRLFDRDFEGAFLDASEEEREAYVVRWSAARALGYLGILGDTFKLLESGGELNVESVAENICSMSINENNSKSIREISILCIGGGAGAEFLATGYILGKTLPDIKCKMDIIDVAPWDSALGKLYNAMITPPTLSKYAADHIRAQNKAMVDSTRLSYAFSQYDILSITPEKASHFTQVRLVTFFFTLNELFTASLNQTRQCLQILQKTLPPGALVLIVDSAGSYSHVQLGKDIEEKRNYPMIWLLDLIMTPNKKDGEVVEWEKINSSESTWFRVPSGLKYPVELENMRYQLHLYRKMDLTNAHS